MNIKDFSPLMATTDVPLAWRTSVRLQEQYSRFSSNLGVMGSARASLFNSGVAHLAGARHESRCSGIVSRLGVKSSALSALFRNDPAFHAGIRQEKDPPWFGVETGVVPSRIRHDSVLAKLENNIGALQRSSFATPLDAIAPNEEFRAAVSRLRLPDLSPTRKPRTITIRCHGWTQLEGTELKRKLVENPKLFPSCDCDPCEVEARKTRITTDEGDSILTITLICACGIVQEFARWDTFQRSERGLRAVTDSDKNP